MQHPEQLCYFIDWHYMDAHGWPEWLCRQLREDLASLDELQDECAEIFVEAVEKKYGGKSIHELRSLA